ncbi:hypothetical protein ABPG73_013059 [Tetrahymena malaccensis]
MQIVQEKKEQQRENQKIMGLTHWNYMMGQLLFSTYVCVIIVILFYTSCFIIGEVYVGINFIQGIILYITYAIAMVCQLYFFTSFFSCQKLASDIISLVNLFFCFSFIIAIQSKKILIVLLSLAPQAALVLGLLGDGWDVFGGLIRISVDFSVNEAILVLLFDIAVYLLLYLYLDQIWSNEYGTQKSPLFIFQSIKNFCCKKHSQEQQQQDMSFDIELNDIELCSQSFDKEKLLQQQIGDVLNQADDYSSALYHQQIDTSNLVKTLQISNLTKQFHGQYAVKQISLSLYKSQIFCLLGHNGAGKTTTINLITGMIQKTQGQVIMNGLDLDKDLDEIRRNIGICSQKNILYDNLTVDEHLWFYARIKLIPDQVIRADIVNITYRCNLLSHRYTQVQHLSGGNKRKLCLAIALIGQSKFILLDEPTSGVDVTTRKQIWDILREMKNDGRTIILTTHHLEEAEALADRIGIMSQGQLIYNDIRMNLEINSLEDVFISIGTDEQRYLNLEQQQQQEQRQIKLGNFDLSNTQIPQYLKYEPSFSFYSQTQVIAIRRIKMLIKNKNQVISYIFPFSIIGLGYFFVNMVRHSLEYYLIVVIIVYSRRYEDESFHYFGTSSLNTVALISSIFHLIFAMYLEKSQIFCQLKRGNQFTPIIQTQRDIDVVQEEQSSSYQKKPIIARNISKQYDNKCLAINGISFGVQKKQIFGLIGPNGSGKTTTFNILTGKDKSSSGYALVNQEQAIQTNENAWQNVGICSQFDNLWEDLTVYDHLAMFASLKGLQGEKREKAIKQYIYSYFIYQHYNLMNRYFAKRLQLEEQMDKKPEILSSGNRRKLCVGMALIGSPNIQFFDEPSSGLDPIAKRFLWNTLKQNFQLKDASILLTTHSMNEAESLCSKIENAYEILKEDLKNYNEQFIQIVKLSPRYASSKSANKDKNQLQKQQQLDGTQNLKKLKDITPQYGLELINKHLKQFEKYPEQMKGEQPNNVAVNNKYVANENDKKIKIVNSEKCPLNKQMLISRFIQRNQKELTQNYENIEEDLKKPFGFRSQITENATEQEVDKRIDALSTANKIKQGVQKQNESFQNTVCNFRRNYNNHSKPSTSPNQGDNDLNMNTNSGKRTPNLSSNKRPDENLQSSGQFVGVSNTIYSQNVYNRIILKQTERKKMKLKSIGQINDINSVPLQSIQGLDEIPTTQKASYTKQNFYTNSKTKMSHSFYNPDNKSNIKKQQSGNLASQPSQSFYQVDSDSFISFSPNKQQQQRNRPQTHQQFRRKIYSSHINYNNQQQDSSFNLNLTSRNSKNIIRVASPNLQNNQSSSINQALNQQKNPELMPNVKKNQNQQYDQALFQIHSYHSQNTQIKNKPQTTNGLLTQEDDSNSKQNKSEQISNSNLNKKRQGILKQMNDFKQRVNREKEIKQQEAKLKKNISKNDKELTIEAVGFASIKPLQNQLIEINNSNQQQMTTVQDTFPNYFTTNEANNMSINQLTDQLNLSSIQFEQKNSKQNNQNKAFNSLEHQVKVQLLQKSPPKGKSSDYNQRTYSLITASQNQKIKEEEGINQLRKSNKNLSKYEIIKQQVENEKKRKKMQELVAQSEIENQRMQKRKHLQNLYIRLLNQQGFSLYVENKELSPELNYDSSTQLITDNSLSQNFRINQDSPCIKKLVKYYDNKYGEKFEQQFSNQQIDVQENQTFGIYDQQQNLNNLKNPLLFPSNQRISNKRGAQKKDKNQEMGPWNSQNDDDIEELINNKKNI